VELKPRVFTVTGEMPADRPNRRPADHHHGEYVIEVTTCARPGPQVNGRLHRVQPHLVTAESTMSRSTGTRS